MQSVDRIRFHLIEARRRFREKRLAAEIEKLLADAMIEERWKSDGVTEADLERRYGFTPAEIKAHGGPAVDRATVRFVRAGAPDPAFG
ncbi:MAG: hypothetical protein KDK07_09155 [Bauldia sp.]|nr:hypothetical protein [Bauldia sp.]